MPRVQVVGFPAMDAEVGQTLLEACDAHGIPMTTECGGFAACNSCRVRVLDGELSEVAEEEEPFLDLPDHRLGCQARLVGDVSVVLDPGI